MFRDLLRRKPVAKLSVRELIVDYSPRLFVKFAGETSERIHRVQRVVPILYIRRPTSPALAVNPSKVADCQMTNEVTQRDERGLTCENHSKTS